MKIIAMYMLECADGTFYVGSTKDLFRRLEQHQMGDGAFYTRDRLPIRRLYFENFSRIDEAFIREHQVKKWSSKKKRALMEMDKKTLKSLSKGRKH